MADNGNRVEIHFKITHTNDNVGDERQSSLRNLINMFCFYFDEEKKVSQLFFFTDLHKLFFI